MKEANMPTCAARAQNPFDDGAKERLRRMGLFAADGAIAENNLLALSCAFAGALFDDLCDFYQEQGEVVLAVLRQLYENAACAESRQRFLLLCLQYDALSQPLPNLIWWISGDPELAGDFAEHFIRHLKKLSKAMEGTVL